MRGPVVPLAVPRCSPLLPSSLSSLSPFLLPGSLCLFLLSLLQAVSSSVSQAPASTAVPLAAPASPPGGQVLSLMPFVFLSLTLSHSLCPP